MILIPMYIISFAIGLLIFISSFVPEVVFNDKFDNNSQSNHCLEFYKNHQACEKFKQSSYSRQYDKFVFIVIDALRADFVPSILESKFNVSLPFIERMIKEQKAISFVNKVPTPTVTLPQIKTIVSGRASNFIDIFNNFNAKKLTEDSFLHQAQKKGLKSVFYGDETWLKVFPDLFIRSEGTHSFFVQDFTEVDNNVTRHLKNELSMNDWDIMILHYLGVDHIGHGFGPHSLHLNPKLKEMDSIIQLIHSNLQEKLPLRSMIVICGDHGMTSEGNHGGPSKSETLTPLVFLNVEDSNYRANRTNEMVSQVDIAPTISVLLGLPIPKSNLGSVILDVLHYCKLSSLQVLDAILQNILQLHMFAIKANSGFLLNITSNITEVMDLHLRFLNCKYDEDCSSMYKIILNKYTVLLNTLKNSQTHHTNDKSFQKFFGNSIMWMSWIGIVLSLFSNLQNYAIEVICSPIIHKTLILSIIASVIHSFFGVNLIFFWIIFIVIYIISIILVFLLLYYSLRYFYFTVKVSVIMFILHLLCLFSSSFIEKEYLFWYFSIVTIFVVLAITSTIAAMKWYLISGMNSKHITLLVAIKNFINFMRSHNFDSILLILFSNYVLRDYGASNTKEFPRENVFHLKEFFLDHPILLLISQIIIVIYLWPKQNNKIAFYLLCSGLLFNFMYKTSFRGLLLSMELLKIDVIFIPWIIYLHVLIIILSSFYFSFLYCKKSSFDKNITFVVDCISAWILLTQLIGQLHLLPIGTIILIQEVFLSKISWKYQCKYWLFFDVSLYLQMAFNAYFNQGNSNNLSTIDVSSGYVGLLSYKPIVVGCLMACNTYSSFVFWFFLLYFRLIQFYKYSHQSYICVNFLEINKFFLYFLAYRLFILALYCIIMILMEHHLFIMSVFAPKFIYEVGHTTIYVIFFLVITISQNIFKIL